MSVWWFLFVMILFGSFLALLFIGAPISVALGVSSLISFLYLGENPIKFVQIAFTSVGSFPLMALPAASLALSPPTTLSPSISRGKVWLMSSLKRISFWPRRANVSVPEGPRPVWWSNSTIFLALWSSLSAAIWRGGYGLARHKRRKTKREERKEKKEERRKKKEERSEKREERRKKKEARRKKRDEKQTTALSLMHAPGSWSQQSDCV